MYAIIQGIVILDQLFLRYFFWFYNFLRAVEACKYLTKLSSSLKSIESTYFFLSAISLANMPSTSVICFIISLYLNILSCTSCFSSSTLAIQLIIYSLRSLDWFYRPFDALQSAYTCSLTRLANLQIYMYSGEVLISCTAIIQLPVEVSIFYDFRSRFSNSRSKSLYSSSIFCPPTKLSLTTSSELRINSAIWPSLARFLVKMMVPLQQEDTGMEVSSARDTKLHHGCLYMKHISLLFLPVALKPCITQADSSWLSENFVRVMPILEHIQCS